MTTAPDPDDKRALFQRIVDDVLRQIEDHELLPNNALPSARKLADTYGVSVMTSQRALRELQYRRITYSVAGRGTFVHPNAIDLLRGDVLREPVDDPELARQSAEYQNEQHRIYARFLSAASNDELNDALADLLAHAQAHSDLIDKLIAHQAERGNFAQEPDWLKARRGNPGNPGNTQAPTRAQRWFADSVRRTAALTTTQPTQAPPQAPASEEPDAAPSADDRAAEPPPPARRSRNGPPRNARSPPPTGAPGRHARYQLHRETHKPAVPGPWPGTAGLPRSAGRAASRITASAVGAWPRKGPRPNGPAAPDAPRAPARASLRRLPGCGLR